MKNILLLVNVWILIGLILFIIFSSTYCTSKKTITMETAITLVIEKVGTGSITASWAGGSATDEELAHGIQIMPNTEIKLQATTDSANVLWAYANSMNSGKVLPLLVQQNITVNVAFYNLSFVNRVTIKKVHGVGMVQGLWHGGSSTDAELTKELTVPKGTRLKISAISNSPKVVWNHDMQHPRDTVSFFVLKDTVIEVGFYDPVVTVRKVHGTGTVSALWDAGAGTATDAELAGEVALPKGVQLTINGASASPKVVWNGDMQHPSKDISFTVEKDTIIRVGFYDPIVKIEKIGGVGTVSGSWNNSTATDAELLRGIELPIGTQINFTPTTNYYHTAWTYGKEATKADTVNTSSCTITQDTTIKVNFFNIIYAAGYYRNASGSRTAFLSKDGKIQILSDEKYDASVTGLYVSDAGDVYAVGWMGDDKRPWRATLWENGKFEHLDDGSTYSRSAAMATRMINGKLYICGFDGDDPTLWIDKQLQVITDSREGALYDVLLSGNDLYLVGVVTNYYRNNFLNGYSGYSQASVWTNGKLKLLYPESTSFSSRLYSADVSYNGDTYFVGEVNNQVTLWKNDEIKNGYLEAHAGSSTAYKVYCTNDTVYVGGMQNSEAALWKNGKLTSLTNTASYSVIQDISIHNKDIYMVGAINNHAALWINEKPQYLNVGGSSEAYAIFVR